MHAIVHPSSDENATVLSIFLERTINIVFESPTLNREHLFLDELEQFVLIVLLLGMPQ